MTNIVVSLELSKKLKELGVEQISQFWWNATDDYCSVTNTTFVDTKFNLDNFKKWESVNTYKSYSAYLSDELLMWLPRNISILQEPINDSVRFQVVYDEGYMKPKKYEYDNSLSNALALMLIYLLEHNLLKKELPRIPKATR